jgi:hypothetical protein
MEELKPIHRERLALGLSALESGRYPQGTGCIHLDNDSYCCLGVFCDVYRIVTGRGRWATGKGEYGPTIDFIAEEGEDAETPERRRSANYLPDAVREWYGFAANDPVIQRTDDDWDEIPRSATTASEGNDQGWDFDRIAALFRQEYGI